MADWQSRYTRLKALIDQYNKNLLSLLGNAKLCDESSKILTEEYGIEKKKLSVFTPN
jgi:hypothetical protein